MRDSLPEMLLVLLCTLAVALGNASASDEEVSFDFVLNGVKGGLKRSPDHYVAALVQVTGPPDCENPKLDQSCEQPATIIRLFTAKGTAVLEGDSIQLLGRASIGSRCLVFAVPVHTDMSVYGGAFMSGRTDQATQRDFAAAIEEAGLQPR